MKLFPLLATALLFAVPATAFAARMTLDQAAERALEEVPGGHVESVENDVRLGQSVIEVEVDAPDGTEHELVFDSESGRLLSHHVDD
jgi:uncharacterized membrane protein YkoI